MNRYRCDAIGNGQRFFDSWGSNLRWVDDAGCWYSFSGREGRWIPSDEDVREMGKLTVDDMYSEGLRLVDDPATEDEGKTLLKWAKTTANSQFDTMLKMARSIPSIRIKMTDFDYEPYYLNTFSSGVIDLRSSHFVEEGAEKLLITKRCGADPVPDWHGGFWENFLNFILPDEEVRVYLQKCLGYMAFAGVEERLVLFLMGETGHGKSKFVEAIQNAMGDYAVSLATDQLLIGAKDTYGLARLPGARMIQAAEFEEGQKINTALVKRITSGEPVTVRMAYGKPFDYTPVGTIVISTNHLPWLGGDEASWKRVRTIPFTQSLDYYTVQGIDEKLEDASGEVLSWIIEGAGFYWKSEMVQGSKLSAPDAVIMMASDEQAEQRHYVLKFIDECFDGDTSIYQDTGDIYKVLKIWAEHKGISERELVQQDWMGRRLREGKVLSWRTAKARRWAVGRLVGGFPGMTPFSMDACLISQLFAGYIKQG